MIAQEYSPGYVLTDVGRLHYVTRGTGPVLVLLHQTPRSWDEFEPVLNQLDGYRLIAPDLLGHGNSAPTRENTIEEHAAGVLGLLDALGVSRFHLVGHHFGGLVAYHVAAVAAERVESLVLSSTPYIDAPERERRRQAEPFNVVPPSEDGSHLARLWQRRTDYLAGPDQGVLSRYMRDVLGHPDADRGHAAVAKYRSEDYVGSYAGPVLCIASARDPRAFPVRHRIRTAFPHAREVVLADGDISAPERVPGEFAEAIRGLHAETVAA
ncbi:alpha/beta fold hydrolase [Prauserella oleivorans]|uniref:Alpha/beta fold hydrolase n=1 Tax=Prauserella oleivorans TaxID=1478153 RepID=A0ABW5WIP9_9PSEU